LSVLRCSNIAISILFFFFNDTATTEIYTLSLHDALPILLRPGAEGAHADQPRLHGGVRAGRRAGRADDAVRGVPAGVAHLGPIRSEEHTSELQSRSDLVCRLLLEKKKQKNTI